MIHVQAGRGGNLGVPGFEISRAENLRLSNVEDLVLRMSDQQKTSATPTYQIRVRDVP
jgi:hypothetical protein